MKHPIPNRWPDWMMGAFLVGCIGVGAIGVFSSPTTSLTEVIGATVAQIYSVCVIFAGVVGLAGILISRRRVTVIAVVSLALATIIRGVVITVIGSNGWQTGLSLLIFPLIMIPGVKGWSFWMTWRSLQRKDDYDE